MRKIKGYICAARIDRDPFVNSRGKKFKKYVLFGRRINETDGFYENFASNNLSPYENLTDAQKGQKDLIKMWKREFDRVEIRKLELEIAETKQENDSFLNEKSLVAIWTNFFGNKIIGHYTGGIGLGTLYGDYITQNNFTPFDNFKMADYARSEATRQSENSPATLAKFKISRPIKTINKKKRRTK